jgi:hypothetical protein
MNLSNNLDSGASNLFYKFAYTIDICQDSLFEGGKSISHFRSLFRKRLKTVAGRNQANRKITWLEVLQCFYQTNGSF